VANRVIKLNELKHYSETPYHDPYSLGPAVIEGEVDKNKSISEMTTLELRRLINRLRDEQDAEHAIRVLRRSAGQKDTYENPAKIDTKTPVNQLYHWGILGMKWGRRRFQNEDGSRTAAGKRREAAMEKERSEDYIKSRENRQKGPESLSNEELKKLNERLQLESVYQNLTSKKIDKAESFVQTALKKAAGEAFTEITKNVFLGAAKTLIKELSPSLAEAAGFGKKAAPVVKVSSPKPDAPAPAAPKPAARAPVPKKNKRR
jgi:hypothetical protein